MNLALNPLPVALMLLFLGLQVAALWWSQAMIVKRLNKLEREAITTTINAAIDEDMAERHAAGVRHFTAGCNLRAGEPVYIADDGLAYPVGLKREVL